MEIPGNFILSNMLPLALLDREPAGPANIPEFHPVYRKQPIARIHFPTKQPSSCQSGITKHPMTPLHGMTTSKASDTISLGA